MRAVVYTRVSQDSSGRGKSVADQEVECRAECVRRGWTVLDVLTDNDRSASRFAVRERPAYQELVRLVAAGTVDVLVTWEASRRERDMKDFVVLRDLCSAHGVLLSYSGRTFDMDDPDDRYFATHDVALAEREAGVTQKRVQRGIRRNAMEGRPHGRLTYGYRREYDDRGNFLRQCVREDQAAVVREAAERTAKGEATSRIVAHLNERDIKPPAYEALCRKAEELLADADAAADTDRHRELTALAAEAEARAAALCWDLTSLRRVLLNPAYTGKRVHRGKVIGDGNWPAILSPDLYAQVQARLTDPARLTRSIRDGAVKHLLTNVGHCAECGGPLKAQKVRGGRYAYLCEARFCVSISALWIEPFVEELTIRRLERDDIRALLAPAEDPAAVQRARDELATLRRELDEATATAGMPGGLSLPRLAKVEANLAPRIEVLQRIANPVPLPAVLDKLAGPGAADRWHKLDVGQRRQVVRLLVDVRVSRGRRGERTFNPARLGQSRWAGDEMTWSQRWAEAGVS